jgi:small-conductance mechanosensitive channel
MDFLGLSPTQWQEVGIAAAIVVGAVIVARLGILVLDRGVRRFTRHTRTGFDDAVLEAARVPLFALIVVIAFQISLGQLSFLGDDWAEALKRLIIALYLLIGYLFVHRLVDKLMRWYAQELAARTESNIDEQVLPFARRVILIVLGLIVFIVLLSHFKVDVSALVTTLGIGSLAIALAAQATLADTINGFVIMTDRPFRIGDRIEILELGTWGDVLDIGLRSTRIRTRDNRMVVVPNSVIGKSLVVNHSVPSTVYRVETHVGIGYGTDVDYARRVMVDAVRAEDWVMHDERIEALFLQFGDSAMIFRVRCWIEHYVETRRIMDKLNSCLYRALDEAGIETPAPIRTLYHRVEPEERDGLIAVLRSTPGSE